MDNIVQLLTEIRDNLAALRAQTANAAKVPEIRYISKRKAAEIAGVHGNTIDNWAHQYTRFRVGTNQYDINMLARIMRVKGRHCNDGR